MHPRSGQVALLAVASLVVLLATVPATRRKMKKLARLAWDGDAAAEALGEALAGVAAVVKTHAAKLAELSALLATVEADTVAAVRAAAGGVPPSRSSASGVGKSRAALTIALGSAHASLWKAQDTLDTMNLADVAVEEAAAGRRRRKELVKALSGLLNESEALQGRLKALAPFPRPPKDPSVVVVEGEKLEGAVRGYKVNANGRKTTYFNHDLDDEAKALIGDITPQRIVDDSGGNSGGCSSSGAAAWNSAGTWEERNVTAWARERARALFGAKAVVPAGELSLEVVGLQGSVEGDAAVARVRGKTKAIFELGFTLRWRITSTASGNIAVAEGTVRYDEVTGDSSLPEAGRMAAPFAEEGAVAVTVATQGGEGWVEDLIRSPNRGLQPLMTQRGGQFLAEIIAM